MPILYKTAQYSQYNLIQEDPDLSKGRIFIENMGCDVKDLNVRFGEFYQRQGIDGVFAPTGADDFSNYPPVYTTNKSGYFLNIYSRQVNEASPGHCDPWIASLDYENYPGVRSVKTSSGLIVVGRYSGYSTSTALADWWLGYDMSETPTGLIENVGNLSTMFYEDPQEPDEYFCLRYYVGTTYLAKAKFTPLAVTVTDLRSTAGTNVFFVGRCADNTAMFVEVEGNHQSCYFYNVFSRGTPELKYTYLTPNPNTYHYQYPSNIRHDSDTRKVFYQGGWDSHPFQEFKKCYFERFIFDPITKNVTSAPCTINFPAGTDSTHYQIPVWWETTWHASTRNGWYYKPHQFSIGNRKFITWVFVDKTGGNFWSERAFYYRGVNRCNWMTFEIDANDDKVLTFHSVIKWEEPRDFPRYYMPINESGTQLMIIRNENVCTISFDVEKGWFKHDVEFISARSAAIDNAGRIYLVGVGSNTYYETGADRYERANGYGFFRIFQYNPTIPSTVSVEFENSSYNYLGSPISTNLLVDARNTSGERIAKTLRITLIGENIKFSDNSAEKDVVTLTGSTLSVPVVISGGGKPTVTVTIV